MNVQTPRRRSRRPDSPTTIVLRRSNLRWTSAIAAADGCTPVSRK
jgi:hypothetical protein